MNRKYHRIYRETNKLYQSTFGLIKESAAPRDQWSPSDRGSRLMGLAVETVGGIASQERLAKRLRPDAKHFLIVNLHQILLMPLAHRDAGKKVDELLPSLAADTLAILRHAEKERQAAGKKSIVVNHVMSAIVKKWDALESHLFNIWG